MTRIPSALETVLGKAEFARLRPAIRKHYDVSGEDRVVCRGIMSQMDHSLVVKPLLWMLRPLNALVPYRGKNVKAEVSHWVTDKNTLEFRRNFHFPGRRDVIFESRMAARDDVIIEYLNGSFLGVKLKPSVSPDGELILKSTGFVLEIGGFKCVLPTWLVPLGTSIITEKEIAANEVAMTFESTHPLIGKTVGYSGTFRINKASLA